MDVFFFFLAKTSTLQGLYNYKLKNEMTLKLEFFSRKKKKQTNKAGKTGSRISCTVFKLHKVFITRVVLYLAQKQYFSLFTVSKSALYAQDAWPGSRARYPHQRSKYRVTVVQCHI